MSAPDLSEAEVQVLASIRKAEVDHESADRAALEAGSDRYWRFLEDWSGAFDGLLDKGLIEGGDDGYRLTAAGRPLGIRYHAERPDMYWYYYQRFYPAARASSAHTRLCERVFGLDLTQEGMTDMPALHHLLQLLEIDRNDHVLDLGCGAGAIAEYVSGKTGARVTGLDYSAPAISAAMQRTRDRSERLNFIHGDLNDLDLPQHSFDAVICLDALYWVSDLPETLARIARLPRRGGRMGVFMLEDLPDGRTAGDFSATETSLGACLSGLELAWNAHDYTLQNEAFWRRNHEAAKTLQAEFEAEGNGFIAASLIREAEQDFLPLMESRTLVRYLYHVRL